MSIFFSRKIVALTILVAFLFSLLSIATIAVEGGNSNLVTTSDSEFVKASGNKFKLGNDDFYFMGTNIHELAILPKDGSKTKENIKSEIEKISATGVKVIRYWSAIGESLQAKERVRVDGKLVTRLVETNPSGFEPMILNNGQMNEKALETLDYTMAEIGKNGMKSIFTFVNFEPYCNPMDFFVQKYVKNVSPDNMDKELFYTKKEAKDAYKNFVANILNRRNTITGILYKDDPSVFAWELCNEPHTTDNYESSNKGSMVFWWLNEMAKFVKSIDSKHMVTTGEEGYRVDGVLDPLHAWVNDGSKGVDFKKNVQNIPEIDFATLHVYPDNWDIKYSERNWVFENYILDRVKLAREANNGNGKPVVIEESGYNSSYGDRDVLLKEIYDYSNKVGVAGTMVWAFRSSWPDDNGYNFGLKQKGAKAVIGQAEIMNALSGPPRNLIADSSDVESSKSDVNATQIGSTSTEPIKNSTNTKESKTSDATPSQTASSTKTKNDNKTTEIAVILAMLLGSAQFARKQNLKRKNTDTAVKPQNVASPNTYKNIEGKFDPNKAQTL